MVEPSLNPGVDESFLSRQHVMFAFRCAKYLPTPFQAEDNSRFAFLCLSLSPPAPPARSPTSDACRMALAYFCLSSLALLPASAVSSAATEGQSALDALLKPAQRKGFVDWVYEQQAPGGGFRGSDSMRGTGGAPAEERG